MSEDLIVAVVYLAIFAVTVAGWWKMFEKAGKPGWGALIPFYNTYLLVKVAGRPGWWLLLYFIPLLSLIPTIIVPIDVAKRFGKGIGFGLGCVFLPFVFYPLLGFGDAEYIGPDDGIEDA